MTPLEQVERLADVPLRIDVEIGRPRLKLGQLLELEEGSIVPLARSAGEDIDIRVGGEIVACGEIIVTENAVGVRITDLEGEE
jgi:flagellar motor switch protein FliN/FliY